jgi:glycyl-tRNA synthetase beta chain
MTTATLDLLLEIGTEEIPARMIDDGARDLANLLEAALKSAGVAGASIESFSTPRRLAVRVVGVPEMQPDREDVATGPTVAAAYASDGTPTRAAEGFARGQGVAVQDLVRVDGPKGEMVAVRKLIPGQSTRDLLATILPATLARLSFPKAMRWNGGTGPFVRPVHWVCAILGCETIPFVFHGITSSNLSRGHRFMAGEPFVIESPTDYEGLLASRHVIVRARDRQALIRKAMTAIEADTGNRFLPHEALLDEVANLVEFPVVVRGCFDEDFLRLPREVLITSMRAHQRYFAMEAPDGRLAREFGVVANNQARDMSVVSRGNERVLAARLFDARFFWEQDLKAGIGTMSERLTQRLFLRDAGDMARKTGRVRGIVSAIATAAGVPDDVRQGAERAALICKADLMSAMVGEFPELQGVMGMYYARQAGEPDAVADAVRDHYLPRFAGDAIPGSTEGAILALADRLDSIVTSFRVGAIPTGSKDPLALRRQAIATLRILSECPALSGLALPAMLDIAWGTHDGAGTEPAQCRAQVDAFFQERFRGILVDEAGIPTDFAAAVVDLLTDPRLSAPPADLLRRARALRDFADQAAGFRDFLDNVFKRVGNILKKADTEMPGWRGQAQAAGLLNEDGDFLDGMTLELERDVEIARQSARSTSDAARGAGTFQDLLQALYSFKDPLARFFGTGRDGVPVLIEADEGKRLARLALLDRVLSLFNWFADFSRISTR